MPNIAKIRLAACAAASLCLAAGPAAAAASLIIVHGIPGRALGATVDPALPVDVSVAGKCLLPGFTFGTITNPIDVPAGTYPVAISLANPIAPCTNSAVISANVAVADGSFSAIVAQISTAGAPAAGVYPVDVSSVPATKQRFVTIHAADAPAVQAKVASEGAHPESVSFTIAPGTVNTQLVPQRYSFVASVFAGSAGFGPLVLQGDGRSLFVIAAVGTATGGEVSLLGKVIPGVY